MERFQKVLRIGGRYFKIPPFNWKISQKSPIWIESSPPYWWKVPQNYLILTVSLKSFKSMRDPPKLLHFDVKSPHFDRIPQNPKILHIVRKFFRIPYVSQKVLHFHGNSLKILHINTKYLNILKAEHFLRTNVTIIKTNRADLRKVHWNEMLNLLKSPKNVFGERCVPRARFL